MDKSKEAFLKATKPDLQSGALKFETDFVSKFEIYNAVAKWAKEDERLLHATIRHGGDGQIAVDFLYQTEGLPKEKRGGKSLNTLFKPYFQNALGGDYLTGWDYSDNAIRVK